MGAVLGEAASLWLMLDAKTRRPVRMPESVLRRSTSRASYAGAGGVRGTGGAARR